MRPTRRRDADWRRIPLKSLALVNDKAHGTRKTILHSYSAIAAERIAIMASSFASPRTCARHVGALQSLGRARLQSRIVRHSFVQGRLACSKTPGPPCHDASRPGGAQQSSTASIASAAFWTSNATWRRATVNTFRCLVGCTAGDFSAMWFLQSSYPELGMEWVMAISSSSSHRRRFDAEHILTDFLAQWSPGCRRR